MSFFKPNRFFTRITQVDIEKDIIAAGKKALILDIDNTILTRDTHEVPADIEVWLQEARDAGLTVCLVSNNWHEGVHHLAARLELPIVSHAVKPLPFAYMMAFKRAGIKRRETVCIGDQLITDVFGGHFLGMPVIMVKPLVKADLKHTLILRHVEKLFLRDLQPEK